jgi:hypothetical protein
VTDRKRTHRSTRSRAAFPGNTGQSSSSDLQPRSALPQLLWALFASCPLRRSTFSGRPRLKDLNIGQNDFPLAPIGGVLGGVFLITAVVTIIVPCARRRQNKRLKWLTEGGSSANVLRKDVGASGLLKGSLEEIVGGQVQSVIFWTPWCVLLNPFLS